MRVIEIVIYFTVALALAGMVIYMLYSLQYGDLQDTILDEQDPAFTVDTPTYIGDLMRFWQSCGYGSLDRSLRRHVTGTGMLNSTTLFELVKQASLCSTLQSKAHDCGIREDVVFQRAIPLPALINASCDSRTKKLVIG